MGFVAPSTKGRPRKFCYSCRPIKAPNNPLRKKNNGGCLVCDKSSIGLSVQVKHCSPECARSARIARLVVRAKLNDTVDRTERSGKRLKRDDAHWKPTSGTH